MKNDAASYNAIKAEAFSIYNKDPMSNVLSFLASNIKELKPTGYVGLKAEILFYNRYKKEFLLDPVWDYGIHADFSGNIDGCNNCRIDVTTNIDFKKLSTYDPIQRKDDRMYKIAVVDPKTGELLKIVDLNFPFDARREGRLFDVALFMPAETNRHGECLYNYYQNIITLNSAYPEWDFKLVKQQMDWYIPDIKTMLGDIADAYEDAPDDDEKIDVYEELRNELADTVKFLRKVTNRYIVACGQRKYKITDPRDGDGEYVTHLYWKHPLIADMLPDDIDTDISLEL